MRALFRYLFARPILWLVARFESAPNRERIFDALTSLKQKIETSPGKNGFIIPLDTQKARFIIFSDQHKGAKNGADDFALAEPNYRDALHYYDREGFHLISLGDSEELWENTLTQVKRHNQVSFEAERKFAVRSAFTKLFGNHDLDWEINPLAAAELKEIYAAPVAVLEGVILQTHIGTKMLTIFCTHGHQGDAQSDGNFFSKFFVSKVWAPLQAYLRINPNTPAHNNTLKTAHNSMMYEWSSQQNNLLLITGHTHQPVFESLTHLERLQRLKTLSHAGNNEGHQASQIKPTYYNTGCCCFDDGDITGIEIMEGNIKLVKWERTNGKATRLELETTTLEKLADDLA
jgi:hypothetical protein